MKGERVISLLEPLSFQSNLYNEQTILQAQSTIESPRSALGIQKMEEKQKNKGFEGEQYFPD